MIQNEQDLVNFNAYPNPIIEQSKFELNDIPSGSNYQDFKATIYDLNGKILFDQSFDSNSIIFQREDAQAGNYIYVISYNDTKLRSGKLILI